MQGLAIMIYGRFCLDKELGKAARGKKTKLPVGLVIFLALDDYPSIQLLIGDAFGIS